MNILELSIHLALLFVLYEFLRWIFIALRIRSWGGQLSYRYRVGRYFLDGDVPRRTVYWSKGVLIVNDRTFNDRSVTTMTFDFVHNAYHCFSSSNDRGNEHEDGDLTYGLKSNQIKDFRFHWKYLLPSYS